MESEITESKIGTAIEWAYEQAVSGVRGTGTAQELAEEYLANEAGNPLNAANSLIRWQNTKAATAGFLTGLGGILTLPVTIPANVASMLYLQLRMIAAIAHMGSHDIRDPRVKGLIFASLTGTAATQVLKDAGLVTAQKVIEGSIALISGPVLTRINSLVAAQLVKSAGTSSVVQLTKAVPGLGGLVGAIFDSTMTNAIGNLARDTFILNSPARTDAATADSQS
jgi:hypothetical protein